MSPMVANINRAREGLQFLSVDRIIGISTRTWD